MVVTASVRDSPPTKTSLRSSIVGVPSRLRDGSVRRRNSAYRRNTNTYAKRVKELQRTLDVQWIIHNFIRVHFTTPEVPAVKLGILETGLACLQVFMIRQVA